MKGEITVKESDAVNNSKIVKKELRNGIVYTAAAKYSGIIINLILTGILARILTPTDFGVAAITTVLIVFFSSISDNGISAAIIQNKSLTIKDYNNLFSFTILLALIFGLILFFTANIIASIYKQPILSNTFKISSISIFFSTITIVPNSLVKKEKLFHFIAKRTVIVQIISGLISVTFAIIYQNVYAIIISSVISSLLLFIATYIKYPLKIVINKNVHYSIKKILHFSVYQFSFVLTNYISRNLDKIIVGKGFGFDILGFYEKSYRLMMMPVANLSNVITPTLQPIFSEFQNNLDRQYEYFIKIMRLLSLIAFPLSAIITFVSTELVLVVFGEKWIEAIPVFKILSLSVAFQILYSPQGGFYQGANAVKIMFHCGLFTSILSALSILIGVYYYESIYILSYLISTSYLLAFMITYFVLIKKVYNKEIYDFLKILIRPTILSLILALILILIEPIASILSIWASLILKCSISSVVILIFYYISGDLKIISSIRK